MTDELLPCPFCGCKAEILTTKSIAHGGDLYGVMCNFCTARTDVFDTEESAIDSWNSRAPMSYEDLRILLDESGVSERTCKEYGSIRVWQSCNVWSHELSCGHEVDTLEQEPPNYCPNCGAKVVSE